MKHLSALCLGLVLWGLSSMAMAQTPGQCLVRVESTWGEAHRECQVYDGYRRDLSGVHRVALKNVCETLVEVKVAVEEEDGCWKTFPTRILAQGDTLSAVACRSTGKYMYWAKLLNDPGANLPTDGQIAAITGRP